MSTAPKTLVVCHDAGGAQLIAAYLADQTDRSAYTCIVDGPAKDIFKRFGIEAAARSASDTPDKIIATHDGVKAVLLGSSWSTSFEIDVGMAARKKGIRTIVYLDHWINYRERFGFPEPGWEVRLPDEFWLGDDYGLAKAKECFPDRTVRFEENRFFLHLQKEMAAVQRLHGVQPRRLLWLSEPLSETINPYGTTAEHSASEYETLTAMVQAVKNLAESVALVVRLHPSEQRDKYSVTPGVSEVVFSDEPDLLADIAQSEWVVGMESIALVVALKAGKPTASFVPNRAYECPLPFSSIQKLKTVAELRAFLS